MKYTEQAIPIVINKKYIVNSNELFTGFRNLTIDNAPIIPNDKAIFPAITFVMTKVIAGNNKQVKVKWYVPAHLCLDKVNESLIKKPIKEDAVIETKIVNIFYNNLYLKIYYN